MTDAPEWIWVKPFHNGAIGECWHDATTDPAKPWEFNEYIRADLHAALETENAALREALERIEGRIKAADALADAVQVMRVHPIGVLSEVHEAAKAYGELRRQQQEQERWVR